MHGDMDLHRASAFPDTHTYSCSAQFDNGGIHRNLVRRLGVERSNQSGSASGHLHDGWPTSNLSWPRANNSCFNEGEKVAKTVNHCGCIGWLL